MTTKRTDAERDLRARIYALTMSMGGDRIGIEQAIEALKPAVDTLQAEMRRVAGWPPVPVEPIPPAGV